MECCHYDGNFKNNHLDNLRWDTHKNNSLDKIRHGTHPIGELNPSAKLSYIDVYLIKCFLKDNIRQIDIAKTFNVSTHTIRDITYNKSWNNVTID